MTPSVYSASLRTRTRTLRSVMQAAFVRSPIAFVLHAVGLAGLMLVYQQMQLPLYVSVPSYLLLALWPWLGPWQRRDDSSPAAQQVASTCLLYTSPSPRD